MLVPSVSSPSSVPSSGASSLGTWQVVCWIDSKALFGDELTHRADVLPQAEAYVHRYGPGLVIYWFGHAPLKNLMGEEGGADGGNGGVAVAAFGVPNFIVLPGQGA